MNPESAKLICSLRLAGFKERKGADSFINFIIKDSPGIQVCIYKYKNAYYILYDYSQSENEPINKNTISMIMEL